MWAHGYRTVPKPPPVILHTRADGTTYRILTPELATHWLNLWGARLAGEEYRGRTEAAAQYEAGRAARAARKKAHAEQTAIRHPKHRP